MPTHDIFGLALRRKRKKFGDQLAARANRMAAVTLKSRNRQQSIGGMDGIDNAPHRLRLRGRTIHRQEQKTLGVVGNLHQRGLEGA